MVRRDPTWRPLGRVLCRGLSLGLEPNELVDLLPNSAIRDRLRRGVHEGLPLSDALVAAKAPEHLVAAVATGEACGDPAPAASAWLAGQRAGRAVWLSLGDALVWPLLTLLAVSSCALALRRALRMVLPLVGDMSWRLQWATIVAIVAGGAVLVALALAWLARGRTDLDGRQRAASRAADLAVQLRAGVATDEGLRRVGWARAALAAADGADLEAALAREIDGHHVAPLVRGAWGTSDLPDALLDAAGALRERAAADWTRRSAWLRAGGVALAAALVGVALYTVYSLPAAWPASPWMSP